MMVQIVNLILHTNYVKYSIIDVGKILRILVRCLIENFGVGQPYLVSAMSETFDLSHGLCA